MEMDSQTPEDNNIIINTHLTKSLSLSTHLQINHHHPPPPMVAVSTGAYKECLKNHAATMGGHVLDGCGEFMPHSPNNNPFELKCAACGCHRSFHRRDIYNPNHLPPPLPPPPPSPPSSTPSHTSSGPSSPQQSPVPYSCYASAPHMLLALSSSGYYQPNNNHYIHPHHKEQSQEQGNHHQKQSVVKKRSRTKFSEEQKEKMWSYAERLGWTLQGSDARLVAECCNEAGVCRDAFKVWMHNHKKRIPNNKINGNTNGNHHHQDQDTDIKVNVVHDHVSPNGSYSSS